MFRRRRQFDELIERQLDLFASEHQDELREIAEARLRWRRASVEDAEEAFGDEADRVEWAAEELELYPRKEQKRVRTEWEERIRRARRRVETAALDLALQVAALWYADLARVAWGGDDLVRNVDRRAELSSDAGVDPQRLRAAVEAVEDTRLRFQLNVSEELACESLAYRLERLLAG